MPKAEENTWANRYRDAIIDKSEKSKNELSTEIMKTLSYFIGLYEGMECTDVQIYANARIMMINSIKKILQFKKKNLSLLSNDFCAKHSVEIARRLESFRALSHAMNQNCNQAIMEGVFQSFSHCILLSHRRLKAIDHNKNYFSRKVISRIRTFYEDSIHTFTLNRKRVKNVKPSISGLLNCFSDVNNFIEKDRINCSKIDDETGIKGLLENYDPKWSTTLNAVIKEDGMPELKIRQVIRNKSPIPEVVLDELRGQYAESLAYLAKFKSDLMHQCMSEVAPIFTGVNFHHRESLRKAIQGSLKGLEDRKGVYIDRMLKIMDGDVTSVLEHKDVLKIKELTYVDTERCFKSVKLLVSRYLARFYTEILQHLEQMKVEANDALLAEIPAAEADNDVGRKDYLGLLFGHLLKTYTDWKLFLETKIGEASRGKLPVVVDLAQMQETLGQYQKRLAEDAAAPLANEEDEDRYGQVPTARANFR